MKGYFFTDQGQVRSHNEDAGGVFHNADNQLLAVVADGMGGHRAGDVASQIATTSLHNKWTETVQITSPEQAEQWLLANITEANKEVFNYAIEHEECKGMGTTIVAAICTGDFVTVGHIGDSRCYLANDYGFRQITEDHSLVNELVRSGQISREDAEHHPRKNVLLKALGTEVDTTIDVNTITWESGNKLLLCSDGLSNKMSDEEIYSELKEYNDIAEAAHSLVQLANNRGGEDNISLSIVHYEQLAEEGES